MIRNGSEVVVVTGATSGVGRAVAERFARAGARVGLVARGQNGLEGAAKDVERAGGEPLPLPTDVADPVQVEAAAAAVEQAFGPIDVWVNNAMTTVFAEATSIAPAEFRRVTEVTYLSAVNGTLSALNRMLPRDRGSIVQVGSALAYRSIPLQSAYCAAKHAVEGFTQSLRCELLHRGSHVGLSMVQLPALNTPQFDHCESKMPRRAQPVPPIYQPEVAAEGIFWAAHHRRREVWVGGTTAATILANRFVPGLLDRYLGRNGYDSQQSNEFEDPDRPANLWEPVAGDPGAHGRFDPVAHPRSLQLWGATHRGAMVAVGGALAAGLAGALLRLRAEP